MKAALWIGGGLACLAVVPLLWFGFWYAVVSMNEWLRR